jgi:hypothetical protein
MGSLSVPVRSEQSWFVIHKHDPARLLLATVSGMSADQHDDHVTFATAGTIRLSDPADLVAGLAALFGFWPRHSLMFVALDDRRGVLGFRARADLPEPPDVDLVVSQLVQAARANDVSSVILLSHSQDTALRITALEQLADAFAQRSVSVVDALHLDDDRFWSLHCVTLECCPPQGRPYDCSTSRLVVESIGMGLPILANRSELYAEVAEPRGATARRMRRLCDELRARLTREHGIDPACEGAEPELAVLKAGADRVKALVAGGIGSDPSAISEDDVAELAVWCRNITVRDIAWALVDSGNPRRHLLLWQSVARRTISPFEPAVLSLAAFCAWRCGDGARASLALDRALGADRDYSMARLIDGVLRSALSPSIWRPVSEEAIWEVAGPAQ